MPSQSVLNIAGLNLYVNPLLQKDGELIQAVNVDSNIFGAKIKRSGYETYLGTANGSSITTLFAWQNDTDTQTYLYRASGNILYYYDVTAGTGDWAICGNGTITPGGTVSYAVLENTLLIADGVGSTRHTTNGTAFTNTTAAPVANSLAQYQGRIYAGGTANTLFFSTTGTPTNWSLVAPADSSSLQIPGPGALSKIFVSQDRLMVAKNSGLLFRWDGFSLVDMGTSKGPTSPASVASDENLYMWINRDGHVVYNGTQPQLNSNAIQPFFFNKDNTQITGTQLFQVPSGVYRYNYYASLGTVSDDFTDETLTNAVMKYDMKADEYTMYDLAHKPTAFARFKDKDKNDVFIFGASNGRVYKFGDTLTSDAGEPIQSILQMILTFGSPHIYKKYNMLTAYFNPASRAIVQVATTDTFVRGEKQWVTLGQAKNGVMTSRFPSGSHSRILYVRIIENSKDARSEFYGLSVDVDLEEKT